MGRPIRFLLDGEVRELGGVDPTLTVLNWLRYDARRTGTKEGCAEGDCGACTVVLGELDGERVRFRAVNACILFAPMLDGRALFTVESLGREGDLHPVQKAMVDHHGSQCGFCTPGFVMSLYAHQRTGGPTDMQSLKDILAGNLCRCTGYGPILAAGQAMGDDPDVGETGVLAEALAAIRPTEMLALTHKGRGFFAPRSADELAAVLETHPDATIVAGATDVGLWVTKQRRLLPAVVSLNDVADLRGIHDHGGRLRIEAGVRYADAHAALTSLHPEFGDYVRRLGGLQVRNLGTVCGNIANGSPIGDMAPALIAAGATLILRKGAARRTIPLEAYFLAYAKQDRAAGEFIEAVEVPHPGAHSVFKLAKLSKRFDQDISAVSAGFNIGVTGGRIVSARVAFGGMAATPKRAVACETALIGQPWTLEAVTSAAEALARDFTPLTDMRASAGYRLDAARALLIRAHLESVDSAPRLLEAEAVAGG